MRRPCMPKCLLFKEMFDASEVVKVNIQSLPICGHRVKIALKDKNVYSDFYKTKQEAHDFELEVIFEIAKANNLPIRATDLLLQMMKKFHFAEFLVTKDKFPDHHYRINYNEKLKIWESKQFPVIPYDAIDGSFRIKADCPVALRLLFQFNEDGDLYV